MGVNIGSSVLIHIHIRSFRERNGLTQEQVADFLNMSVNGYGDIERGETDIKWSRLVQISNLYEISVNELINPNSNATESTHPSSHIPTNSFCSNHDVEMYKLIIELKDNEISLLKKMINLLESR